MDVIFEGMMKLVWIGCLGCLMGLVLPVNAQRITLMTQSSLDSLLHPPLLHHGEEILRFEKNEDSVGTLLDSDAPKVLAFTYRAGKRTSIRQVKTFCGCTTAEYEKQELEIGAMGEIKLIYNPKNRIGTINEYVYVYTSDSDEFPVARLLIQGEVKEADKWGHFSHRIGKLRLKRKKVVFNEMTGKNSLVSERIWCVNSDDKPLKISALGLPDYVAFRMEPEILEPGKEGDMIITVLKDKLPAAETLCCRFFLKGTGDETEGEMMEVIIGNKSIKE